MNEYSKLRVIFNPLTFSDISPNSLIKNKEKIVLVVSRMSEYQKRISIILKVWMKIDKTKKYKDWKLIILGKGDDFQKYSDYIENNHISNVEMIGQQNAEPYYRRASLFLMTSSMEGWGLTLTESLQRGVVPIVMNSTSVFEEILENNKTGFLIKNNDNLSYFKKLSYLMDNKYIRHEMAANCLNRAKLFSIDKALDLWENLINELNAGKQ